MPRTALEVVQSGAPRLAIDRPDVLFPSADQIAVELQATLNECAARIVKAYDWQALKVLDTDSGDGATTDRPLPTDFLRMPKDGQIWSTRWQRPLQQLTPEERLRLEVREYDLITGTWTIVGGSIVYTPALAVGEEAKYYYISKNVVRQADATVKERFTADDDTFLLDDRVLELALIWQWREQKGMDYAEDMKNAEEALSDAIGPDKGARMVVQSSRRNIRANVSYPWEIVP